MLGADNGQLSGQTEHIVFTPTKIKNLWIFGLIADGTLSSGQTGQKHCNIHWLHTVLFPCIVHMTSAPAMIGYKRQMFRGLVGITCRRGQMCGWPP
jgi:hypothetical protein